MTFSFKSCLAASLAAIVALSGCSGSSNGSSAELAKKYSAGKGGLVLTVGILKNGEKQYKVFGGDLAEKEHTEHIYEIGSISKTITTSLLCREAALGHVALSDISGFYIAPERSSLSPTLESLATHTSGYGDYPFDADTLSKDELERIDSDFNEKRINIYQGLGDSHILERLGGKALALGAPQPWEYSNFGMAVLGNALAKANGTTYRALADEFLKTELGLSNTHMSTGKGDLSNYWQWDDNDAYLAAGGAVSTVGDMLAYAQYNISERPSYLAEAHKDRVKVDGELYCGLGWMVDKGTGFIWHNGETSSYRSFIGFDKKNGTAVVILSNYPAENDDDDTVDVLGYTILNELNNGGCKLF